jgi:hypothetical protein
MLELIQTLAIQDFLVDEGGSKLLQVGSKPTVVRS